MSFMSCITNDAGISVHFMFPEMQCWTGIHFLHAIVGCVTSFFFSVVCLLVVIIFYECRNNSNDPLARNTARPNFTFLVYEIVMIVCFTFMNEPSYHYLLMVIELVGTVIVFSRFHYI